MTTIITIYAIVAAAAFLAYHREPVTMRLKLSALAPFVLVAVAVVWVVTRLEELG